MDKNDIGRACKVKASDLQADAAAHGDKPPHEKALEVAAKARG